MRDARTVAGEWDVPAGYSGTPLPKKLGIKDDSRVWLVDTPEGFPIEATVTQPPADVGVLFFTELAELEATLDKAQEATFPDGAFWVCWPKRASKVPTDITEDRIRDVALPRGLVDNKVCSVNATWSGLRLCTRRELRTRT